MIYKIWYKGLFHFWYNNLLNLWYEDLFHFWYKGMLNFWYTDLFNFWYKDLFHSQFCDLLNFWYYDLSNFQTTTYLINPTLQNYIKLWRRRYVRREIFRNIEVRLASFNPYFLCGMAAGLRCDL